MSCIDTAYAQNFEDKNWYHFDDSHVTKVDVSEIKTTAAYLLFYKRRRNPAGNTKSVEEILQEVKEKNPTGLFDYIIYSWREFKLLAKMLQSSTAN